MVLLILVGFFAVLAGLALFFGFWPVALCLGGAGLIAWACRDRTND